MSAQTGLLPSARYAAGVEQGLWEDDPAQRQALPSFDALHAATCQAATSLGARLRQWIAGSRAAKRSLGQGLYLWGQVGRGKTFLMDLFVEGLPPGMAERWHFHRFMGMVQTELKRLDGTIDPLLRIGAAIGARARVLRLDEFQVGDIGDAMILAGLLRALESAGVTLVTTSNTPPLDLYRNGLQRARFLPAIAWIEEHCRVLQMDSPHDWRLRALKQAPTWLTPLDAESERQLARIFDRLTHGGSAQQGGIIQVLDRPIVVRRLAGSVAWFGFDALCGEGRAVADYIEIGRSHDHVLVSSIPQFNADTEDPALRFVRMVDEFYDRDVKLICSAAVPIIEIYDGRRLRAEFARTESRLIEMQSEDYLARPHRG